MTEDIFVHYLDFHNCKISETVTQSEDGSNSIFLNSRLSQERLLEAYVHALKHIRNCDFASDHSADHIEALSH